MFGVHEICYLKFTVYGHKRKQTYIHTTSANAVTLVWVSLRLAPIIHLAGASHNLPCDFEGIISTLPLMNICLKQ